MKKLFGLLIVALMSVALLNGCVPARYTKTVVTHRDASGKVTGSTETETIAESRQEPPRLNAPASIELLQNSK